MKFTGFRNAAAGCFIAVMAAGVPAAAEAGMYYAGTSNNWTFQPMNYDNYANAWYIDLYLSGNGDNGGSQRFKVTDSPDWNHRVWGTSGGRSLCTDQNRCGDIRLDGYGQHRLYVGRHGSWWRLDGNGNGYNNGDCYYGNNGSASTYNAGQLYYAGTSNGLSFTPMNRNGNSWYVDVYLSGNGDNGGSQRFKITDSSGWNGNVWGSTGGRRLCNDQNRCGDIRINGQGQYRITVSGNKWSARRIDGRGNRRYNNNNYNYNNNGYYDDGYYDNGGAASDTLDRIENSRPVRKLRDGVRIIDDVSSLFGD